MTGDLKVKESWLTENVSPAPLRFCHPEKEATEITINFVPRLVYPQLLRASAHSLTGIFWELSTVRCAV